MDAKRYKMRSASRLLRYLQPRTRSAQAAQAQLQDNASSEELPARGRGPEAEQASIAAPWPTAASLPATTPAPWH